VKRRFVLCVDNATKEQQDTLTEFLKETSELGYWHWFSDVWLVIEYDQTWTAGKFRDHLNHIIPGANKMVFQIDGDNTWSGFGNEQMFKWMKDTWQN
jgi:hypothetical protein